MRRKALVVASSALLLALVFRAPMLSAAGRLLVVTDPVVPVDVIVVAVDSRMAGVLEAADLFHLGVAPQVGVFAEPPDEIDREFIRRGVPYFDVASLAIRQLHALGVLNAMRIPSGIKGTREEGIVLPRWLKQHGFRSVIFVTSPPHSRRAKRILRRDLKGDTVTLIVKPSRYSKFDPNHWWQDRDNLLVGIMELLKLATDVVVHPIS